MQWSSQKPGHTYLKGSLTKTRCLDRRTHSGLSLAPFHSLSSHCLVCSSWGTMEIWKGMICGHTRCRCGILESTRTIKSTCLFCPLCAPCPHSSSLNVSLCPLRILREQLIRAKYERKEFQREAKEGQFALFFFICLFFSSDFSFSTTLDDPVSCSALRILAFNIAGLPDAVSLSFPLLFAFWSCCWNGSHVFFFEQPLKVGSLNKKGKESTKWAPRHLVLKTQLHYYKRENVNPNLCHFTFLFSLFSSLTCVWFSSILFLIISLAQDPKELGVIDMKNTKITFASAKSGKPFSLQLLDGTNDRNYFFCASTARVCGLGAI